MNLEKKFIGKNEPVKRLLEYKKISNKEKQKIFAERAKTRKKLIDTYEKMNMPLSRRQRKLLGYIYSGINQYFRECGIPESSFQKIRLFFIDPRNFNTLIAEGANGMYNVNLNLAFVKYYKKYKDDKNLPKWLEDTIHELIHSRSYQAWQICGEENTRLLLSRIGPYIVKNNEKGVGTYFEWLNEASVVELSVKIAGKIINQHKELFIEDIKKLEKRTGKHYHNLILKSTAYITERKILKKIIENIANNERKSKEEISKMFYKSLFTGNLLPIARSIEKIYGPGSFRVLANVDSTNYQKALEYVDLKNSLEYREKLAKKIIRGQGEEVTEDSEDEYTTYQNYKTLIEWIREKKQKNT